MLVVDEHVFVDAVFVDGQEAEFVAEVIDAAFAALPGVGVVPGVETVFVQYLAAHRGHAGFVVALEQPAVGLDLPVDAPEYRFVFVEALLIMVGRFAGFCAKKLV